MKYIKLFEKKVLDDILDKMNKGETPTDWEKKYLKVYGTPEADSMEDELKPELPDAFKDDGKIVGDFGDEFDDERIIEFWDELDTEDMTEFLTQYKVMPEFSNQTWHKLSDGIKDRFSEFLQKKGLI